jgi:hypothetical protein
LALTVPFNVAPVLERFVAGSVTADGASPLVANSRSSP